MKVGKSYHFEFLRKNRYYALNKGNRLFWGSKVTLLNFSINLLIRFLWYCTWLSRSFLCPNSTFQNFSLNLLIRCFWIFTWHQALTSERKWLFWIFQDNPYYGCPKLILLNFSLVLFCRFFCWKTFKNGQRW